MLTKFFKIIIMGLVVVGLLYAGTCVYANWPRSQAGEYRIPEISQAKYELTIRSTGNIFYTDAYEQRGQELVLQGYWELVDNKFKFRDREIILDKLIFGEIIIRRR